MKNLDLYKAIILLSIVLIPAAGFFAYWQYQQHDVATKAVRSATKANGLIEKIGLLQKELESVKASSAQDSGLGHLIYFERHITASAERGGIKESDLKIGNERFVRAPSKARAADYEVDIDFQRGGKAMSLPRGFIHAVLMNLEKFSKSWRLRKLKLVNTEAKGGSGRRPPPKTVADDWEVATLVFARREPEKKSKK